MLKPRQDFILVLPLERRQSTVLAIVSHEKHCRGEVIAVGPGKTDKKGHTWPLAVKPGDIVAFGNGDFDFYPKYFHEKSDGTSDCYRIIQEADVAFISLEKDYQHAA